MGVCVSECWLAPAGQSNYGFANSALDFMCESRLAEGLPALSIQWGVIGHVGFVEEAMQASPTCYIHLNPSDKTPSPREKPHSVYMPLAPCFASLLCTRSISRAIEIQITASVRIESLKSTCVCIGEDDRETVRNQPSPASGRLPGSAGPHALHQPAAWSRHGLLLATQQLAWWLLQCL